MSALDLHRHPVIAGEVAELLAHAVLGQYLSALIDPAEHSMREKLRDFARDHGVVV